MTVAREAESKAVNTDVSVLLRASSGKDFFTLHTKLSLRNKIFIFVEYTTRKNQWVPTSQKCKSSRQCKGQCQKGMVQDHCSKM